MPKSEPDGGENVLSTRELRGELSEAIMRAHFKREHIIVTPHGRKYAALISFAELEQLERLQAAEKIEPEKEDHANAS